jgi:thiol-disulfide isomerase/thioredoxin
MINLVLLFLVGTLTTQNAFAASDPYQNVYGRIDHGEWLTSSPNGEKAILYVFWATWCEPCMHEVPHLNELQQKFESELDIVGVNVEGLGGRPVSAEAEALIRQTVAEKFAYPVVRDDRNQIENTFLNAFLVHHIPHAILINPEGRVIWAGHPGLLDQEMTAKLLDVNHFGSETHRQEIEQLSRAHQEDRLFEELRSQVVEFEKKQRWIDVVEVVSEAEKTKYHLELPNYKAHALLNELGRPDEAYAYAFELAGLNDGYFAWYRLYSLIDEVFFNKETPPADFRAPEVQRLVDLLLEKIAISDFANESHRHLQIAMVFNTTGNYSQAQSELQRAYELADDDFKSLLMTAISNLGYALVCEANLCKVIRNPESCTDTLTGKKTK